MRWKEPTWQAKTIISCFANWKECTRKSTWSESARATQSVSLDCRLATNQHLKSADLRHQLKIKIKTNRAGFKTRPLTFRLGRVTNENQHFPLLQLFIIDFKPSFKLRVGLPKMRKKVLFYMSNTSAGSMVVTRHWTRTEQISYFVALINV